MYHKIYIKVLVNKKNINSFKRNLKYTFLHIITICIDLLFSILKL